MIFIQRLASNYFQETLRCRSPGSPHIEIVNKKDFAKIYCYWSYIDSDIENLV